MIQRNTVNGRLPFQISVGLGNTMVTPLLIDLNPHKCDSANIPCFGLNAGQSTGLGVGLFVVGLACGILATLLVLLVVKLCCLKTTPSKSSVTYEKQNNEVAVK